MKNGALRRSQRRFEEFGDLLLLCTGAEQQQEFVAGDPRQHVGVAQLAAEPLGELDQQRVADARGRNSR